MFTVCFDASGDEKVAPYIVVAGFISTAQEWIVFSEKWKQTLSDFGLPFFRASEFQNSQGEFKTWKGDNAKRIRLYRDLTGIIENSVHRKFGCGVTTSDFSSRMSLETKKKWKLNCYSLCAMRCAEGVQKWARIEGITTPIEYVFENGDDGKGMIISNFETMGYPTDLPPFVTPGLKKLPFASEGLRVDSC